LINTLPLLFSVAIWISDLHFPRGCGWVQYHRPCSQGDDIEYVCPVATVTLQAGAVAPAEHMAACKSVQLNGIFLALAAMHNRNHTIAERPYRQS